MKKIVMGAILASALIAGPAFAAGDAAAGKDASKQCAPCHGPEGISKNPKWPNLAGQKDQYLIDQMKAFKSGARKNPLMLAPMKKVSDDDIANLAAHFSALK